MTRPPSPSRLTAVRGEIVHFLADPAHHAHALEHFADGVLVVRDGHVAECGPAAESCCTGCRPAHRSPTTAEG